MGQNANENGGFRYSHKKAVAEVERLRREFKLLQKEVALGIGITEPEYSQKKRGIINSFSLEEFSELADFFSTRTGRPLIGFPFLDRQLQDAVDRKVGGWNSGRTG